MTPVDPDDVESDPLPCADQCERGTLRIGWERKKLRELKGKGKKRHASYQLIHSMDMHNDYLGLIT